MTLTCANGLCSQGEGSVDVKNNDHVKTPRDNSQVKEVSILNILPVRDIMSQTSQENGKGLNPQEDQIHPDASAGCGKGT